MQMTAEEEDKVGKKNGGFYPKSFSPRVIVFIQVFYMRSIVLRRVGNLVPTCACPILGGDETCSASCSLSPVAFSLAFSQFSVPSSIFLQSNGIHGFPVVLYLS